MATSRFATKNKNKTKNNHQLTGFTLIELVVVITLIIILFAAGITGLITSQRSFIFNNAYQQVISMVREARSLAVSAKAQPDYTDYDQDGLDYQTTPQNGGPDQVTPAHYGVYINTAENTITLFADTHKSNSSTQQEGIYDPPPPNQPLQTYSSGHDVKLAEYTLPEDMKFIVNPSDEATILYTPLFADTVWQGSGAMNTPFYVFGIEEIKGLTFRKRCFAIHPVSGVPETTQATGTDDLCKNP